MNEEKGCKLNMKGKKRIHKWKMKEMQEDILIGWRRGYVSGKVCGGWLDEEQEAQQVKVGDMKCVIYGDRNRMRRVENV